MCDSVRGYAAESPRFGPIYSLCLLPSMCEDVLCDNKVKNLLGIMTDNVQNK